MPYQGKRYDVLNPVKVNGRTFWTRCGSGFPSEKKADMVVVNLHQIPLNGRLVVQLAKEPQTAEKEDGATA